MSRNLTHAGLMSFLICALFIAAPAQDQDSIAIRKYYDQNTILWTGTRKYFKNNQSCPVKNLRYEYAFSKEATQEYQLYRKYNQRFWIVYVLSAAAVLIVPFTDEPEVGVPILLSSLVGFGISLPIARRAQHHFHRAIWVHNRDVLLR